VSWCGIVVASLPLRLSSSLCLEEDHVTSQKKPQSSLLEETITLGTQRYVFQVIIFVILSFRKVFKDIPTND